MNTAGLLEKRNTIYGICAIWIVLFHIFRRISMPYIPVVTNIVGIGNWGVDIFFFFSGLCLSLSVKKHHYTERGWGSYYGRRFTRVLLPYFIIGTPFYLWAAVFETYGSILRRCAAFLADLSSASFWLRGTQTTWYLYGIVTFYLLFPHLYSFTMKNGHKKRTLLIAALIMAAILSNYIPVVRNSMILWARLPAFTIGVLAGTKEPGGSVPDIPNAAAAAVILISGTVISISEISDSFNIPQVYRLLLYIPMTLSLMAILSRHGGRIGLFEWIGGLSLEIYLIHITLLHPLKFYGILDAAGYWIYLILPVVSVLLAWCVGMIEKMVLRRLESAK